MKALFLDRDGIINDDSQGYTYKIDAFFFMPYIFDFISLFIEKGYSIFIVTNQSGIGRGYYSQEDFATLNFWLMGQFQKRHIQIEKIYYCPHSPQEQCVCRKPLTGMIDQALQDFPIDLAQSIMIGDKQSDIDLATNASIAKSIGIGTQPFKNASYSFSTITQALDYFKTYKGQL